MKLMFWPQLYPIGYKNSITGVAIIHRSKSLTIWLNHLVKNMIPSFLPIFHRKNLFFDEDRPEKAIKNPLIYINVWFSGP